jgi:hypothetical protein
MKKMSSLTRNFILDNIKVNITVSSYPFRTVTPTPQDSARLITKKNTINNSTKT